MSYINSRFATVKNDLSSSVQRSRFRPRPFNRKTTFNAGRLVPLLWLETMPGDIMSLDLAAVIRSATPKTNPLDDAFVDITAFYVPYRILWNHWQQFNGENDTSAWTQNQSYLVPSIIDPTASSLAASGIGPQSLLNYLELPLCSLDASTPAILKHVSDLPVRAYYEIWNWNYRDENTQSPILYSKGDTAAYSGSDPLNPSLDVFTQGGTATYYQSLGKSQLGSSTPSCVMPVNRFHDYFSSCLPAPFKQIFGAPNVPIDGTAPVFPLDSYLTSDFPHNTKVKFMYSDGTTPAAGDPKNLVLSSSRTLAYDSSSTTGSSIVDILPRNLVAGLSYGDASISINDLRNAIAIMHVYEQLARGGSRYDEFLNGIYGVRIKDSHIQRPQYLGGIREPLSFFSVMNTAGSANGMDASSLGTVGAYSVSSLSNALFRQSFAEAGIVMILGCVRTSESYSQGIERKWTRSELFDFPFPEFDSIGDQAVYEHELYVDTTTDLDNPTVFGYQERYGELREYYSRNVGYMDPMATNSIGTNWTYGNAFATAPTLARFIPAEGNNYGRVLQVSPATSGFGFFGDFRFQVDVVRGLRMFGEPGLKRI